MLSDALEVLGLIAWTAAAYLLGGAAAALIVGGAGLLLAGLAVDGVTLHVPSFLKRGA